MFTNPFSLEGRIGRNEYSKSIIIILVLSALIVVLIKAILWYEWRINSEIEIFCGFLIFIFATGFIPLSWFLVVQGIKRCHDIGKNGWYQFIPRLRLLLLFKEGDPEKNEYGNNPRELTGQKPISKYIEAAPFIRMNAVIVDSIIVSIFHICILIIMEFLWTYFSTLEILNFLIFLIINFLYSYIMESSKEHNSLGKKIFNLRLGNEKSEIIPIRKIIIRNVFKLPAIIFYIIQSVYFVIWPLSLSLTFNKYEYVEDFNFYHLHDEISGLDIYRKSILQEKN